MSFYRGFRQAVTSSFSAALIASTTVFAGTPASCPNTPLSCHNTTAVADTCCFNAPGGLLLQTQFWDSDPPTGPNDSWTVHGLWPDNCDGTYEQYCDPNRQYTNISAIIAAAGKTELLTYMNKYWKDYQGDDEDFWEHEWDKHGTCISTLEPGCYDKYTPQQEVVAYFQKAVDLYKTLDSYAFLAAKGITPSPTTTYKSENIQKALAEPRGVQVTIRCSKGELNEIWYFYNVKGSVETGSFVPAEPDGAKSNCPADVKYLPKMGTPPSPPSTTKTSSTRTPPTGTSTPGVPFSGRGTLPVTSGGATNGCIISGGTWYTTGTCATYTATASGNGFTLTSSKGKCAVSNNVLTCAATVTDPTVFTAVADKLAYNGVTDFYTASVPTGSVQAPVSVTQQATTLSIGWKSS
ncbi:Ribonuclease T2 precursor (RNase T2) [Xanthoria parietina]